VDLVVTQPILERVVKEYKEANTMHFVELEVNAKRLIPKTQDPNSLSLQDKSESWIR
jgi:hypothetical protein